MSNGLVHAVLVHGLQVLNLLALVKAFEVVGIIWALFPDFLVNVSSVVYMLLWFPVTNHSYILSIDLVVFYYCCYNGICST